MKKILLVASVTLTLAGCGKTGNKDAEADKNVSMFRTEEVVAKKQLSLPDSLNFYGKDAKVFTETTVSVCWPETLGGKEPKELQDSILEDSDMTAFQKTIAKMSDKTWDLCQRICGVVLALLASVALFWENITGSTNEGGFSYSLIVAVVIALLIPSIIERRGLRKIPKVRMIMVIVLLICIVVYFLIIGVRTGFNFRA